jgi:hypothetical protein
MLYCLSFHALLPHVCVSHPCSPSQAARYHSPLAHSTLSQPSLSHALLPHVCVSFLQPLPSCTFIQPASTLHYTTLLIVISCFFMLCAPRPPLQPLPSCALSQPGHQPGGLPRGLGGHRVDGGRHHHGGAAQEVSGVGSDGCLWFDFHAQELVNCRRCASAHSHCV